MHYSCIDLIHESYNCVIACTNFIRPPLFEGMGTQTNKNKGVDLKIFNPDNLYSVAGMLVIQLTIKYSF